MKDHKASLPLAPFTVLDLTRVRAGPTAVRQLADWGANVIKIEAPDLVDTESGMGGDRYGSDFQNLHRNKKSITLNLNESRGLSILMRLVKDSDVLVENFRPDVKHRLKIDYQSLISVNSGLILASVSGFGQDGPYKNRPGFDQIAQGMGGLMSVTGFPGQGPVRVGVPIADLASGLYTAIGILIALLHRQTTGKGDWVQTSLLESQISMLDFQAARWIIEGEVPIQAGNNHPTSTPTGRYKTSDGYINIACAGEVMWNRFCCALNAEILLEHQNYENEKLRLQHRDELEDDLAKYLIKRTSSEWIDALNEAGVPCGPIYAIDEVFDDPQVKHVGMTQSVKHPVLGAIELLRNPVHIQGVINEDYRPTPEKGQDTDSILSKYGYSSQEIENFRHEGIV